MKKEWEREETVKESNNIRFLPEHHNFKMIAYTWLNIQHDRVKLRNENKDTMKKNLMQSHVYVNMWSKLTEWLTAAWETHTHTSREGEKEELHVV